MKLYYSDGGDRAWIMIEEMGSTVDDVIIPRINHFDEDQNYSVFKLETTPVR